MKKPRPHDTDMRPDPAQFLTPIKGRTRDLEVIDALVGMIEAADMKKGDRLPPENQLAKRLGVGRSTIREAMKAWQSMGIVTRNKGAGTILAAEVSSNSIHVPITLRLEAESLLRTHSVRRPLEIEVSRLAALNATVADRREIMRRMDVLSAIYEAGEDWRTADALFHEAIHKAAGNPLFGQLIHQIHRAFHDIYQAPFGEPQLGETSIPMHRDLAMAVVDGRPDDAVGVMTKIADLVEVEVRKRIENER
jgi:GntR family transcriptional regulator, transcriptional repressor for pyruvate dehydrogenase complex